VTADPPRGETLKPAPAGHRRLLRVNGVVLDLDGHRAFADGTEILLSRKEFDLLCVLLQNAGRVLSRRHLLDTVWRTGYADSNKTLEQHIRRLRRKLDPESPARRIRTVRGLGYVFDVEAARLTGRG
jgi:two-component system response regulator RegX3